MADFPELIERLLAKRPLSEEDARAAAEDILRGAVPPAQAAGFLVALRARGETQEVISGFARAMRASMVKLAVRAPVVLDTCGTGGDSKGTFNISTAAAFVVAGCGVPVAKHGNRSISSRSGSADVLEALGARIDLPKESSERCLLEVGITFLFAPQYHPAMKNVGPIRRELGIRTLFNLLGPLANPAAANAQVIGVPRREILPLLAGALRSLERERDFSALIVHENGYDEMVLQGPCLLMELEKGRIARRSLTPKDLGLPRSRPEDVRGGDAFENARILREALSGKRPALENVLAANAALALTCARKSSGSASRKPFKEEVRENLARAQKAIETGAALQKLEKMIAFSKDQT